MRAIGNVWRGRRGMEHQWIYSMGQQERYGIAFGVWSSRWRYESSTGHMRAQMEKMEQQWRYGAAGEE
jgi:hypothetical protein